jgi:L-asparaginase II
VQQSLTGWPRIAPGIDQAAPVPCAWGSAVAARRSRWHCGAQLLRVDKRTWQPEGKSNAPSQGPGRCNLLERLQGRQALDVQQPQRPAVDVAARHGDRLAPAGCWLKSTPSSCRGGRAWFRAWLQETCASIHCGVRRHRLGLAAARCSARDEHPNSNNPVLVQAWRGGIIESAHRGAAIVDVQGSLHTALGDIDRPIFPRSAIKVLQALPLVASGAADLLQLTDEELALACASHAGEERHARTAAAMLAKAGVDVDALECGTHWPYNETAARELARRGESPSALNNNCSGKHAGFVCLGCQLNGGRQNLRGFLTGYVKPDHAVMREVSAALQAATGFDLSRSARGTDGCSIPTHAVPLRHLALAFARVGSGQGLSPDHAARRLRQPSRRPSWSPEPAASTRA